MSANEHNRHFIRLSAFAIIITIIFASFFSAFISAHPISAEEASRWTAVNIPAEGDAGGWALADGSDVRHLTRAADGTLYTYGAGLTYTLLKSTDGGLRWSAAGQVQDVITGIAVSPHDTDAVYYATASAVYRSTNGGKSFIMLPGSPGGAGSGNITITSLTTSWMNGNIIAAGTRDSDALQYGGAYIFDESEVIPSWTDTGIGSYDVYAVAFSPSYPNDRQLTAVLTNETDTFIYNKIGNAAWNSFTSQAVLNRDNSASPASVAAAVSAVIAFPDDYDAAWPESFFYAGINTGAGQGDVYKITCMDIPSPSQAVDLNIGGMYGAANIDITGLSVYSDGLNITLLAGPAADCRTYVSTDGGTNWSRSAKSPTGDSNTYVLLSRDFSNDGRMYAATSGSGSALSVSHDAGSIWDQVSLIDTEIDSVIDIAPSPDYESDLTLFMTTFGAGPGSGGLWRTANGGANWERILSGVHPDIDTLSLIGMPPQYGNDCRTIFVAGESGGNPAILESGDGGRSFRTRPTRDPATGAAFSIDTWEIVDENTIFIGSYNGAQGLVYKTGNGGFFFEEGTPAGGNSLYSIALSPDFQNDGIILAGNNNEAVFRSTDGGASFVPLPSETDAGALSASIDIAFDPGFKKNGLIYACSTNTDAGFYRFNTLTGGYWDNIDITLPDDAIIDRLAVAGGGFLYGVNSDAGGGMERCLNPGASGPVFERVTLGLSAGAKLSGMELTGSRIWAIDTANNKVMTYIDNLTSPVIQTSPADNAPAAGTLADHTVKNITLDWETAEGATGYEYQCTVNTDFSTDPSGLHGTVSGSSVSLSPLNPGTIYYWRVRVSTPVSSPWSGWRSFTTSLDTETIDLKPESPAPGALNVPIKPVFQWTAVIGASAYELLAAADADFENPVIIKIGEFSLPTNAWECDVSLDYGTTYYWKVRAMTAGTHSTWSSTGVFTTEPAPALDENLAGEPPELSLLGKPDSMTALPAPKKPLPSETPGPLLPPSTAPAATVEAPVNGEMSVPGWVLYIIGGLLASVMLSLLIVLAVVLKIKRF